MRYNKKAGTQDITKKLQKENFKLKIENIRLRNELKLIKSFIPKAQTDDAQVLLKKLSEKERLFSKKNYLSYVISLLKSSSLFKIYSYFVTAVRKYSFITTSIKIFAYVLILLQSSAIFVLSASAFLISLPLVLFISYLVFFTTLISGKRAFSKLKSIISNKKIYFLFPTEDRAFRRSSFFSRMAQSFAQSESNVIIIVSPFFFNSVGLVSSSNFFLAMRAESNNIVIIRRHFYFLIKKKLLSDSSMVVEIY